MRLSSLAPLLLAALPLAACASTDETAETTADTLAVEDAATPEVRYYVIADT